jgi:ribosomal protein S18 acetylase RimI-like enzyme
MNKNLVNIRQAVKSDAPFIAKAVAMAIGDENALKGYCGESYIELLTEIAMHDKSQYSYNNALIAEVQEKVTGVVIGYDGAELHSLRENTYNIINKHLGRTPSIPDETAAGEFYLDTLAVFPEYRNQGIAKSLITAICDKAFSDTHDRVGLIVDLDNPKAESLYTSIGFKRVGTKTFLGHNMYHMQIKKK